MNQEIKLKLDKAAEQLTSNVDLKAGFVHGAQTILENPQEWDLFTAEKIVEQRNLYRGQVDKIIAEYDDLKSQLTKYREALEKIVDEYETIEHSIDEAGRAMKNIAKEVLKQQ